MANKELVKLAEKVEDVLREANKENPPRLLSNREIAYTLGIIRAINDDSLPAEFILLSQTLDYMRKNRKVDLAINTREDVYGEISKYYLTSETERLEKAKIIGSEKDPTRIDLESHVETIGVLGDYEQVHYTSSEEPRPKRKRNRRR